MDAKPDKEMPLAQPALEEDHSLEDDTYRCIRVGNRDTEIFVDEYTRNRVWHVVDACMSEGGSQGTTDAEGGAMKKAGRILLSAKRAAQSRKSIGEDGIVRKWLVEGEGEGKDAEAEWARMHGPCNPK